MSNIGKDYLGCTKARRQGTCSNKRSVRREPLEATILAALRERLMQPEYVATFVEEFTAEWNRQVAEASAERSARTKELEKVERKISGLITAIADGFRSAGIQQELLKLEERKAVIEAELAKGPLEDPPRLHPNLAEVYRDRVLQLHEAMRSGDGTATLEQVRRLIARVIVHPGDDRGVYEIELIGEIAAMIDLAMTAGKARRPRAGGIDRDLFSRSVKVVAGPGFEPGSFRL
jgi:site-specific DNA recombinase